MGLLGKAGRRIAEEAISATPFWDKRLQPHQNKMVEMALNGMRNEAIAEEMMASPDSVTTILSNLRTAYPDLNIPYSGRAADEQERLIKLFKMAYSNANIQGMTGKTLNTIKSVRSRFNKTQPEGQRFRGSGERYAIPIIGGGLLGRLMLDDDSGV